MGFLGKEKIEYDDPPQLLFPVGLDSARGDSAFGNIRPPRIGEVLGLDDFAIAKISNLIQLVNNADVVKKLGWERTHAYLFAGPPGTGKTLAVDAIARACRNNAVVRTIEPEVILDPENGTLATNLRLLFAEIRASAITLSEQNEQTGLRRVFGKTSKDPMLIVKLDEFDQLALDKAASSGVALTYDQYTGVNMLLRGFELLRRAGINNVVFLFTTNYPQFIEPAVLDRLTVVRFFEPDTTTLKHLMTKTLSDVMYELGDNGDIFSGELLLAVKEYRKVSEKLDDAIQRGNLNDIKHAKENLAMSYRKTVGNLLDNVVEAADGMSGRQIDEAIRSLVDFWIADKTRKRKSVPRKLDHTALLRAIDTQRIHRTQQESKNNRRFNPMRPGV